MFKRESAEKEIYEAMQKELRANQLENRFSLNKIAKAADYIGTAAELLDDTGFKVEADLLTKVLKRLANEHEAPLNVESEHPNVIIDPLEEEIVVEPAVQPNVMPVQAQEMDFEALAMKFAAKMKAKKKL